MRLLIQATLFYSLKIAGLVLNQLAIILLALNLTGCVSQEPTVISITEPIPVSTPQDGILKNEIIRLEKLIAEKDELIKRQHVRQQSQAHVLREVNKEATRAQVKLHRLATKPSTASAIAELEVALVHLKQVKISLPDQILQILAHRLLETASVFYSKDQYASAMNYVAQANHLIGLIINQDRKKVSDINYSLLEFHTPVILRTKSNVNLRKEPNASAQILGVLKKGTVLAANANQGTWLRVQADENQGWVLGTILEIEENHNP